MAAIPARVSKRIEENLKNIQKKLARAKELDVSEAQTISAVVKPVLTDILGYDEFEDITDQYVVRGTFCDLAVKANGNPYIMIEAKAVNTALRDMHAKQAKDYGLNSGVEWILLTNGEIWQLYKIIFKQPVEEELVTTFNILELNPKKDSDKQKLFYLCKEAIVKAEINTLYAEKQAMNKFIIGNLLFKKDILNCIRRDLKKMFPDTNIAPEQILELLKNDVIRREIMESDDAKEAVKQIEKAERKEARKKTKEKDCNTANNNEVCECDNEPLLLEQEINNENL